MNLFQASKPKYDTTKQYDWTIVWEGLNGVSTKLNLFNKTYKDAREGAEAFGWTEPKWYQIRRMLTDIWVAHEHR